MAPSVVVAVGVSPRPALCVASWALAAAAASLTAISCLVRRRPPGSVWAAVDVTVAVSVLLLGVATVPTDLRSGSWVGFQPGYALSVACSLVGVRRVRTWSAGVLMILLAQIAYLAPLLGSHTIDVTTALGDLLTLLVIPTLTWMGADAVQAMARTADHGRARAVAASQEAEARRGRVAVHNAAAMMRLLLDLDAGAGTTSTAGRVARAHVARQASDELSRMRDYLRRPDRGPHPTARRPQGAEVTLTAVVEALATEFDDLGVVVLTDLARSTVLGDDVGADLSSALRSLLLNVRQHAYADRVVLHAEELAPAGTWRLTLHDDGRGFDTTRVSWGTGLADVVAAQLEQHRVHVAVDSLPGVGTTVTLTSTPPRGETGVGRG